MEWDQRTPLKVLIADDHPMMLLGVRRALERSELIEVVGEAYSGPHLLEQTERRRPDIVVMDLRMPGVSGVECVHELATRWPETSVVVLSAAEDARTIDSAFEAGARA